MGYTDPYNSWKFLIEKPDVVITTANLLLLLWNSYYKLVDVRLSKKKKSNKNSSDGEGNAPIDYLPLCSFRLIKVKNAQAAAAAPDLNSPPSTHFS